MYRDKFNIRKISFFILSIFIVFWIVLVLVNDNFESTSVYNNYSMEMLGNGWNYINENGRSIAVSIPYNGDVEKNEIARVVRKLSDDIQDGDSLCFRTEHASVRVLVDNKIIYEYAWDKKNALVGNTPAVLWNVVELKEEYAGKTIMINIKSRYANYSGKIPKIYYGTIDNAHLMMLKNTLFNFIVSAIPFIFGIILVFLHPFTKKLLSFGPFLFIGIFLITVGVWEMCVSGFLQFAFERSFTLQIIEYVSFGMIPIATIMALGVLKVIKTNYNRIYFLNLGVFLIYVLGHISGLIEFENGKSIIHILLFVDIVYLYASTSKYFEAINDKKKFVPTAVAYWLFSVIIILDIFISYFKPLDVNGTFTRWGIIVFIIIASVMAVSTALDLQKKNIKQETIVNIAYTDTLTGIKNRRAFEKDTEKLVDEKKNFTIVAIDMNNLKMINDELGHKYGDDALINVANGLKKFEDYGEECYRMGGDEFEVVCTNLNNEQIEKVCGEINEELSKYEYFPGVPLAIAYGFFRYNANIDKEINKVMAQADRKMYEKKTSMKKAGYATRG